VVMDGGGNGGCVSWFERVCGFYYVCGRVGCPFPSGAVTTAARVVVSSFDDRQKVNIRMKAVLFDIGLLSP
jgi:hypothetical protein